MDQEDYIQTLAPTEQKALAVCGVYKTQQLLSVSLDTLLADMENAAEFFPEEMQALSRQRLEEIYRSTHALAPEEAPQPEYQTTNRPEEEDSYERSLPPLVRRHGGRIQQQQRPNCDTIDITKVDDNQQIKSTGSKSNAICNIRPFRTYFSALVHVGLGVSIVLFLIVTFRFLFEMEENTTLFISVGLLGLFLFLYICYARKTKCPVCNIGVYSLHNYPRNKHAHYFPLLGYTLATALHIVFFFWFRCPACGTAQKLFKRRHH